MAFGVVWGVIDKGSLGAERQSETGKLIRVLAEFWEGVEMWLQGA